MPSHTRVQTGRQYILVLLFLALSSGMSSAAQAQSSQPGVAQKPTEQVFPPAVPAATQSDKPEADDDTGPEPRLGIGDLLEINVYNVPELTTKSRLGNNGDVYLPLIDYVHLAGLTVAEGQALIEKKLNDGGFVKNPHVTVLVDQSQTQGASLLGEVNRPGVYPIVGEPRLLDVISAAGGFTDRAGQSITVTHRNQSDKPVTVPLRRKLTDNPASNIAVSPGDTILVHRADVVYVVGEVGRPSGFLMDSDNLTVLKAIALAGGTTRTAKLNGAKIIRKGPNGMTETPVELKKMLQAKAADIPMKPDDILFVPSSASKVLMGRTADIAVQAASAATILAIQ
jgi:polysaccharide biosynthesis/export protein